MNLYFTNNSGGQILRSSSSSYSNKINLIRIDNKKKDINLMTDTASDQKPKVRCLISNHFTHFQGRTEKECE